MNEEVKIKAWVAREKYNKIRLYLYYAPIKIKDTWYDNCWEGMGDNNIELPQSSFPQVQWSDPEPTEVELTIKIKKQ